MNKITRIIPIFVLFILFSCSTTEKDLPLWLDGSWETNEPEDIVGEYWEKESDKRIAGYGYILRDGEQLKTEIISIYISGDTMFYAARVPDQNDGKEILFKASLVSEDHLVFKNPEHDFPTRIVYKLVCERTLEINISGRDEEDSRTIVLNRK